jgi:membrane protein required for colicin V production
MNLLDILILCTIVFFVIKGLMRGFFREIASLAGVILGIFLAARFQPQVTEYLKSYLPTTSFLSLISFAIIFAGVLILSSLLGHLLKLLFQKVLLGWIDRTLGLCLAMVKGIIITYLVIVLLTFFLPSKTPLLAESKLMPWIIVSYQSLTSMISPDHYRRWKARMLGEKEEQVPATANEKTKEATPKHGTK